MNESNEAMTGHVLDAPLTGTQREAIFDFQLNLATARWSDWGAGVLTGKWADTGKIRNPCSAT
jgi:hypothetical protein